MAQMAEVRLLATTTDATFGTCGDVFVAIWRKNTTMLALQQLNELFDNFRTTHRAGCWLVTIVEEKASLPGAAERDAVAAWMAGIADVVKCSALSFEGTGFRAAAVRSVLTGLNVVSRQPFPHQVFGNVTAAVKFLFEKSGEAQSSTRSATVLVETIEKLRAMGT